MFDILRQLPLIPGSISQQDLIKLTRGPFCQAKVQIQTWMGKKSWTQIKRKAMIAKRSTQGAMIVKSWTRGAMITRRRLFCHFPEAPPVVVSSALLRPNCPNCQSVEAAAAFSSPTEQPPPPPPLTMCCCGSLKLAARVFPDFENHSLPCLDTHTRLKQYDDGEGNFQMNVFLVKNRTPQNITTNLKCRQFQWLCRNMERQV